MRKTTLFQAVLFAAALSAAAPAMAQSRPNEGMDDVFRASAYRDFGTQLPPRGDGLNFDRMDADFFSSSNACPDEVNIGSILDDAPVFGGVDIEVVINSDIVINCGGLR